MPAPYRSRKLLGAVAGLTVTALFAGSLATPATAGPLDPDKDALSSRKVGDPKPAKATPDKWFVQVSGSPSLRGGSRTTAKSRQSSVKDAASDAGITYSVLHSYSRVWNGFSVKASEAQATKLRSLPGVTAVYPVYRVDLPEEKASPELKYSLPMIGAVTAQVGGATGAGIKVGVIDTGIDYNHVDLGGGGVNNEQADFGSTRVRYGVDLVGDDYNADVAGSVPVPDAYPDDCNGHGTHVAGIIGAKGDVNAGHVQGVAPDVTLGAYRVFGCDGSSDTEVILAAMDAAAADDMDVVNMSLGDSFMTWPGYPTATAADALTAAGTLVVASAGNSGDAGLFSSGAPAVGKNVISVAAVENTNTTNRYFSVSPPAGTDGNFTFLAAEGAPLPPDSGSFPLARASVQNGCSSLGDLTGKIAVIQRGVCNFSVKAANAQAANAAGVVLYNNQAGVISPTVAGAGITIPVVMISADNGDALWDQLENTPTNLTWNLLTKVETNPISGAVTDFSSYGMSADLTLNPDVAAPGGNIWSTYPIEQKGYANLSGTSMASPHVAGAVALLLGKKPSLKGNVSAVRASLQNTAKPINKLYDAYQGEVIPGFYEPTIRQGAGLIQIDKAIIAATSSTTVTPGKISLGENRSSYYKTTLKLTNNGTTTEKYKLSVLNATNVGPAPTTYWYAYNTKKVSAKFSSSSVTVKAGRTATVSVSIKQPSLKTGWIYGGWVKLTKSDNSKTLVVPFAGIYGDYQKVKLLQDLWDVNQAGTALTVVTDLPALAYVDPEDGITTLSASDPKRTFTMKPAGPDQDDTFPYLLFHLDYPASNVIFNVYKATSKGKKGAEVFSGHKTFFETGKIGRDDSYLYLPFDGKIPFSSSTSAGLTVPNGDYVLEIRALKALGNSKTASHWETFTSPAFKIDRTVG